MGSFSIWHWLVLAIAWLIVGFPAWRIVARTGHHPALSLLFFVPLVNLAMLWFLALGAWPRDQAED